MADGERLRSLSSSDARLVLNSLQDGTVPLEFADLYNVDRDDQIRELCRSISEGVPPRLKFINADYGQGKTQMLGVVRRWAVDAGYAATHVVLRSRGTTLSDLRAVYAAILRNTWRPGRNKSAIQSILEVLVGQYNRWRATVSSGRLNCPLHDHISMLFCQHCYEEGNVERQYLPGYEHLDLMFRRAVSMYRRASEGLEPDRLTKAQVARLLEDDLGYRRGLNFVGVWLPMSSEEILAGLSQIAGIIRLAGFRGLVIALDEAETIPSIGGAGVQRGYENLRALIHASRQNENTYFIYATTPTFFRDVRTHSPDIQREISVGTRMDLRPLSRDDMISLGVKIGHIVAIAAEEAPDAPGCERVAREILSGDQVSVRGFVTKFFERLDVH